MPRSPRVVICDKCKHRHELEREILNTKTFTLVCHGCEVQISSHFSAEQVTQFLREKRQK